MGFLLPMLMAAGPAAAAAPLAAGAAGAGAAAGMGALGEGIMAGLSASSPAMAGLAGFGGVGGLPAAALSSAVAPALGAAGMGGALPAAASPALEGLMGFGGAGGATGSGIATALPGMANAAPVGPQAAIGANNMSPLATNPMASSAPANNAASAFARGGGQYPNVGNFGSGLQPDTMQMLDQVQRGMPPANMPPAPPQPPSAFPSNQPAMGARAASGLQGYTPPAAPNQTTLFPRQPSPVAGGGQSTVMQGQQAGIANPAMQQGPAQQPGSPGRISEMLGLRDTPGAMANQPSPVGGLRDPGLIHDSRVPQGWGQTSPSTRFPQGNSTTLYKQGSELPQAVRPPQTPNAYDALNNPDYEGAIVRPNDPRYAPQAPSRMADLQHGPTNPRGYPNRGAFASGRAGMTDVAGAPSSPQAGGGPSNIDPTMADNNVDTTVASGGSQPDETGLFGGLGKFIDKLGPSNALFLAGLGLQGVSSLTSKLTEKEEKAKPYDSRKRTASREQFDTPDDYTIDADGEFRYFGPISYDPEINSYPGTAFAAGGGLIGYAEGGEVLPSYGVVGKNTGPASQPTQGGLPAFMQRPAWLPETPPISPVANTPTPTGNFGAERQFDFSNRAPASQQTENVTEKFGAPTWASYEWAPPGTAEYIIYRENLHNQALREQPHMAGGGLVKGYVEGGIVQPAAGDVATQAPNTPMSDPGKAADQAIIIEAARAVAGKSPNPKEAIAVFVGKFGQPALEDLKMQVKSGKLDELINSAEQPVEQAPMGMKHGGMVKGDGMSDHIPAQSNTGQDIRLSEGEFVVPADVVSSLGNGDTKSGAGRLQEMMARIRMAKHGSPHQPRPVNPDEVMP